MAYYEIESFLQETAESAPGKWVLVQAVRNGLRPGLFKLLLEMPEHRVNIFILHDCMEAAIVKDDKKIAEVLISLPLAEFDFRRNPIVHPGKSNYLHDAARRGSFEVFKVLANTGKVQLTERDRLGLTPLTYAIDSGSVEIVDFLLRQATVTANEMDAHGLTPLTHAIESGSLVIVKLLLQHETVKVDEMDENGRIPLIHAIYSGFVEIVDFLLQDENVYADKMDDKG
ncbi:hypothetical protein ACHAPU_000848 [Fusarium lateritium]